MTLAVPSLLLAALLGFAINRGSVCMVRGVAEVLGTGRAYMLLSFAKAVLWVLITTTAVLWLVPSPHPAAQGFGLSGYALVGGFLFGIGATVNRGCAFSTLGRLGNGEIRALLTLGGFALGVWSYLTTAATWPKLPQPQPALAVHEAFQPLVVSGLTLALVLWAVFEAVRLWRTRPAAVSWTARLLVGPHRLSTAVALIGIANGILYTLHGPWTYTRTFNDGVARVMSAAGNNDPLGLHWALFFAVVAGAILSPWHRGMFRLDWHPSITWLQDIAGGLLMGFGAGMTPGGNNVLVLHDLPQLSGPAVPALLAMIAGITLVMVAMRATTGTFLEVDCQGDVCAARRMATPRGAAEPAVAAVHDSRSSTTTSERRSQFGSRFSRSQTTLDHGSGA